MHKLQVVLGLWIRGLMSARAATSILSSFGALWLFVEITAWFLASTNVPQWLRDHWWLFGAVGLVVAAFRCFPKTAVSHKLNGRDVTVEIAIGDLFSFDGAMIVGSNSTFDTRISAQMISERSVQGAFTRKYFADESSLDVEIAAGLHGIPHEELSGRRLGKSDRYPIGTVVRLSLKDRTAYFVAIADINEHGVAEGSLEKLKVALAETWVHIGSRGLKEHLVMPVLGSGFSRLPQTREQILREIVKSFVAACSERVLADRLTIVLSPRDVAEHKISLQELGAFLEHVCRYAEWSPTSQAVVGAPA